MQDRDERMKQITENELINKERQEQREAQQQLRLANQLMRQGKREAAHPQEQEDKIWEDYQKFAQHIIETGQKGYDSWVSAMADCCILAQKRVDAINASDPWGWILDQIVEHTAYPIGYLVSDVWHRNDVPKIERLPTFSNFVKFTDHDKLDRNFALVRSDGQPVTPDQSFLFNAGINAWLLMHGFTEDPAHRGVFMHTDGHQLTQDEFNDLRDDREHGLQSFLGGRFDMDFQHQPPSPRPSA